jgi:hypothetical protein
MPEAVAAFFETEPWKSGTAESSAAGEARDLEREAFVVAANGFYSVMLEMEAWFVASVASGKWRNGETEDRSFTRGYRRWLEACNKAIVDLNVATSEGSQDERVQELMRNIEDVRCVLESRELEGSMRPIDEILPLALGNPRPERYGR